MRGVKDVHTVKSWRNLLRKGDIVVSEPDYEDTTIGEGEVHMRNRFFLTPIGFETLIYLELNLVLLLS